MWLSWVMTTAAILAETAKRFVKTVMIAFSFRTSRTIQNSTSCYPEPPPRPHAPLNSTPRFPHVVAQAPVWDTPPPIAQYPFEIVSQRGFLLLFPYFHEVLRTHPWDTPFVQGIAPQVRMLGGLVSRPISRHIKTHIAGYGDIAAIVQKRPDVDKTVCP